MPPTLILGNQQWPLNRGTTTVGRQDTCDIVISDKSLSRAHATFEVSRDVVELTDHNSSNGTFLNGNRIGHVKLTHGDQIRLGTVALVFNWPESVVSVSASPISSDQAKELKQKLVSKSEVKVDWKASLATTAAVGAIATGIIAGVLGAMMGRDAVAVAVMVGAVGGIATSLAVRALTQQRVSSALTGLKDNLDLFFNNQADDVVIPGGFPELNEVVHSIRLGAEIVKDREANQWRLKLHEAQMAQQAAEASASASGNIERGFAGPQLALDGTFRIQGWNTAAQGLMKPGLETIDNMHLMEVLHNAELSSRLVNLLSEVQPGTAQAYAGMLATSDGRPLDCLIAHTANAPGTHQYLVQFVTRD